LSFSSLRIGHKCVHVLRTRKFYKSTSDVSVLEQGLRNGCIRVASVPVDSGKCWCSGKRIYAQYVYL